MREKRGGHIRAVDQSLRVFPRVLVLKEVEASIRGRLVDVFPGEYEKP